MYAKPSMWMEPGCVLCELRYAKAAMAFRPAARRAEGFVVKGRTVFVRCDQLPRCSSPLPRVAVPRCLRRCCEELSSTISGRIANGVPHRNKRIDLDPQYFMLACLCRNLYLLLCFWFLFFTSCDDTCPKVSETNETGAVNCHARKGRPQLIRQQSPHHAVQMCVGERVPPSSQPVQTVSLANAGCTKTCSTKVMHPLCAIRPTTPTEREFVNRHQNGTFRTTTINCGIYWSNETIVLLIRCPDCIRLLEKKATPLQLQTMARCPVSQSLNKSQGATNATMYTMRVFCIGWKSRCGDGHHLLGQLLLPCSNPRPCRQACSHQWPG